jgi:hypothetical protein
LLCAHWTWHCKFECLFYLVTNYNWSFIPFCCLLMLSFVVTMPPLFLHVYKFKYFFSTKNNVVSCPPFILARHVTSSCCDALPSYLPLFSSCNSDPSNLDHIEVVFMSLNRSSYKGEESLSILSKVGIKKQNYDTTRKCQNKWFTKFPWAKCL